MTSGSGCSFKHLTEGRALNKLRKRTSAPVDMIFFNQGVPYHGGLVNKTIHYGTILPMGNMRLAELHRTDKPLVGVLLGIVNYGGTEGNHAIGAVKCGDTLYACDPLGKARTVTLVNTVLNQVAEHYGCKRGMVYNGPNLQTRDSCVGYSSNFIATLLQYFQKGGRNFDQKYYNNEIHRTLTTNVGMVFGQGNETSILRSLEKKSIPKVATRSKPSARSKLPARSKPSARSKARTFGPMKGGVKKR